MFKKRVTAILLSTFMIFSILAFSQITVKAISIDGWQQNDKTLNRNAKGNKEINWILKNGKWYVINTNGEIKTGWVKSNSKWYYLNAYGDMAVNTTTSDGYVVDNNGVWDGQVTQGPLAGKVINSSYEVLKSELIKGFTEKNKNIRIKYISTETASATDLSQSYDDLCRAITEVGIPANSSVVNLCAEPGSRYVVVDMVYR